MARPTLTASLLRTLVSALLRLRYRIVVEGLDRLSPEDGRGILFLPNHPALIDPVILLSLLHRRFHPYVLADRERLDSPLLSFLARLFGAILLPNLARHGSARRPEIERALTECVERLTRGDNLVFYPAGRLTRTRFEDLGANSGAATLLIRAPRARVVLVRTSGLWGSVFSRASGISPSLGRGLLKSLGSLLGSLLVFAPRRTVTVTFEEPETLPRKDRLSLNRYLEAFYNRDAKPNTYVPYTPWERGGTREQTEPESDHVRTPQGAEIPAMTRHQVYHKLSELSGVPSEKLRDDLELAHDLGMDSLTLMELVTWAESEFGYQLSESADIQTIGDILLAACGSALGGEVTLKPVPRAWFRKHTLDRPCHLPEGATIPEAFLNQARLAPGRPILADQIAGVKTYRDLVAALLLLKPELEKIPGPYLGIMLPASVSATVVFLAVQLAGKIPVMVNWTVGPRNMTYSLDLLGVTHILTSQRVVERVESQLGPIPDLKDRFILLENVRKRFTLGRKLAALGQARFSWAALRRATVSPTAVILFTSGSENRPKAVPLTHANILANLQAVLKSVRLRQDDVLLGLLPPFHSFGLSTNVCLPACGGLPCVYHANPTEGLHLARLTAAYGATITIGTPTFLGGMLRVAGAGDLRTLRAVITGAEKCPDSLYASLTRFWPWIKVLEGYGITECSPVVSINDEDDIRPGTIGKVLPGLDYARKRVETDEPAPPDEPGLLLVRGPSIFDGYLKFEGPSPFIDWAGKRWYQTGDLVTERPGGVLTFAGRLKRFVKLGGEMISLPAIEEVLTEAFVKPGEQGPLLAVESTATELNPEIVLFTAPGKTVTREQANEALKKAGLSALHHVRQVVPVEAIPLLGSGKTDYRHLRERLAIPPVKG